jgi:tRNA (guanine-N7-)-methyltransferase
VGSKNKLKRFKENETFENVFQPTREEVVGGEFPLKGKWNSDFFKNDNPIIIELGCGKGEYSVGLAERYPDKNFVGIDIKGARFWRGAKTAVDEGMRRISAPVTTGSKALIEAAKLLDDQGKYKSDRKLPTFL